MYKQRLFYLLPDAWEEEKWGIALSIGYLEVRKNDIDIICEFRKLFRTANKKTRKKIKRIAITFFMCNWNDFIEYIAYEGELDIYDIWYCKLRPSSKGMDSQFLCTYGRQLYNMYKMYPNDFKEGLELFTGYTDIKTLLKLVPEYC